jgi:hypothetical protein
MHTHWNWSDIQIHGFDQRDEIARAAGFIRGVGGESCMDQAGSGRSMSNARQASEPDLSLWPLPGRRSPLTVDARVGSL